MSKNKILVILAGVVFLFYITLWNSANKADDIEAKYIEEMAKLRQDLQEEKEKILDEKKRVEDSLQVIISQRKFTIDDLTQKQQQDNEKIRYIVRQYTPSELDSVILQLFSDLSRFDQTKHHRGSDSLR